MDTNFPAELPGFDPIRKIGSGGFGDVWLAEQSGFDRKVAIKVSQRPLEKTDEKLRFERECRALGRLSGNPNIVGVYTSGLVNGTLPYLVMEYVDGGTLKSRADDLDENDVRRIMGQLCLALQAAHDVGVLHRDLKPENVFLRANGDSVVGDFGIARVAESGQTSTGIPATLLYVAPEILEGDEPTPLSDVYGIGITIASVLLGRSPFASGDSSHASIIARVLHGEPASLNGLGISADLVALIESAMARDPKDRPQSASDLHARLISLDHSNGAEVTPSLAAPSLGPAPKAAPLRSVPSMPEKPTPAGKGVNPVLLGLLAVAAALVFVGGALLVSNSTGDDKVDAAEPPSGPQSTVDVTTTTRDLDAPGVSVDDESVDPSLGNVGQSTTVVGSTGIPQSSDPDLPLDVGTVADATGLEVSSPGFVVDDSPANAQLFCGNRPVVGGLEETAASKYRPQSSFIISQRVARFSSEPAAERHIESFVSLITCESWLSGGPGQEKTVFSAAESFPDELFGDQIFQIDEEAVLPSGVVIFSRVIVVRRDNNVLRISYSSPDRVATNDGAGKLLVEAVANGGF